MNNGLPSFLLYAWGLIKHYCEHYTLLVFVLLVGGGIQMLINRHYFAVNDRLDELHKRVLDLEMK